MRQRQGKFIYLIFLMGWMPALAQPLSTKGGFSYAEGEAFKAKVKHISDFVQVFNQGVDELNSSREEADVLYWENQRRHALAFLVRQERTIQSDSV